MTKYTAENIITENDTIDARGILTKALTITCTRRKLNEEDEEEEVYSQMENIEWEKILEVLDAMDIYETDGFNDWIAPGLMEEAGVVTKEQEDLEAEDWIPVGQFEMEAKTNEYYYTLEWGLTYYCASPEKTEELRKAIELLNAYNRQEDDIYENGTEGLSDEAVKTIVQGIQKFITEWGIDMINECTIPSMKANEKMTRVNRDLSNAIATWLANDTEYATPEEYTNELLTTYETDLEIAKEKADSAREDINQVADIIEEMRKESQRLYGHRIYRIDTLTTTITSRQIDIESIRTLLDKTDQEYKTAKELIAHMRDQATQVGKNQE